MFQELTCGAKEAKGFANIRIFACQAAYLMRGLPICHNSAPLGSRILQGKLAR